MNDKISKTRMKADSLRMKNQYYSKGFWNVWNMSNRQIIKTFDKR